MSNRNILTFTVLAVALAAIAVIGVVSIPYDANAQQSKAITGVSVDNSTRGQLTVDWNDVANAADYRVVWAESEAPGLPGGTSTAMLIPPAVRTR